MKRNDEEACRSAFDRFLLERFAPGSIQWEEVELDPPDFYLYIEGQRFAVEVTQVMENLQLDPRSVSSRGATAFLRELVEKVEDSVREKGSLKSGYVIECSEPLDNYIYLKHKREVLVDRLVKYIQVTQATDSASREVVFQRNTCWIAITKIRSAPTGIRLLETGVKLADGIPTELCNLVERRVVEKTEKLSDIVLPKILLLYDAYGYHSYGFGDSEMRETCVLRLKPELENFHTVFWLRGEDNGLVLYSKDETWSRRTESL
jgi:hypothetical protein